MSPVSLLHLPELLRSLPRLVLERKAGRTVEGYYGRVVGRRNFEELLAPMLSAVVGQDARGFPADFIFKRRPRRRSVPHSFTLRGGLASLPEAMAASGAFTTVTGCAVREIARTREGYRVVAGDARRFRCGAVALATPASVARALLGESHPELSALLAQVRESRIESVGVAVPAGLVPFSPLAGIVAAQEGFYSAVSRDTVKHPTLRGLSFHFRPRTAYGERLAAIKHVLGVKKRQFTMVVSKTNLLPAPALGHEALVASIDNMLTGQPLAVTGNYFAGLSIEDCVARSVREAERLCAKL